MVKSKIKLLITIVLTVTFVLGIPFSSFAEGDLKVTKADWGNNSVLAIDKEGNLWKANKSGKTKIVMEGVKDATASAHYGAVTNDGNLYMWGDTENSNEYGQIGHGLGTKVNKPTMVMENIANAETGGDTSGAVSDNGTLWMWGRNDYGQIGVGTAWFKDDHVPWKVAAEVEKLALGKNTTAAIKFNGSLWMWGQNRYYQILGNTTNQYMVTSPTQVDINDVKDVSLGQKYTAALKKNNSLWVWGTLKKKYKKPHKVASGVVSFAASDSYLAYVKKDGKLYIVPAKSMKLKNNSVVMDGVKSVSAGGNNIAVIRKDGTLWRGTLTKKKLKFKQIMDTTKPDLPKIENFKASAGNGAFTVKWKKASTMTRMKFSGYQLQYSTKPDFSMNAKTISTGKTAIGKLKKGNLKSKKTYYVRLRRYKGSGSNRTYSKWSKTVKVRI